MTKAHVWSLKKKKKKLKTVQIPGCFWLLCSTRLVTLQKVSSFTATLSRLARLVRKCFRLLLLCQGCGKNKYKVWDATDAKIPSVNDLSQGPCSQQWSLLGTFMHLFRPSDSVWGLEAFPQSSELGFTAIYQSSYGHAQLYFSVYKNVVTTVFRLPPWVI